MLDRPGHARRRDGLLPERHARRIEPEDDKVLGAPRRARRAARHPRVAAAAMPAAHRAQAPRLRALLRRAEPHDRADLRRRVRPLPRRSTSCSPRSTSAGCRTSRSRSTTTTSGSTRSAGSACRRRRASTSSAHFHFGYMTDTFGVRNRARRRRRADPVVERLPAHQRRLAAFVAHDPGRVLRRPRRRATRDPRRQRAAPLRVRRLTAGPPDRRRGPGVAVGIAPVG